MGNTNGALPGQTNLGGEDAFVRKYDSGGNVVWTKQVGTSASDRFWSIAADATGVYLAGRTEGSLARRGGQRQREPPVGHPPGAIGTIDLDASINQLTGTVTGFNERTTDSGQTFMSFENLVGGAGNDAFVFADGAALTGALTDTGGTDGVDHSATSGPVVVTVAGYAGFETFVGSKNANDTFTGTNAGSIAGGVGFTGMESLTGGTGADPFNVSSAGSVTKTLTGGAGRIPSRTARRCPPSPSIS